MNSHITSNMSVRDQIEALLADEERANIVRKASEDVNKFISNLPTKKYEDGWSEDTWEEEAEKHPLFLSKIDESQELPPLVEALQSLKYDPEFNDPVEIAKALKEDGNQQFKKKNYRLAIAAYSQGLAVKCEDNELNTVLHSNRAAAFFHMGNYKKSLEDAIAAKTLKADHIKAIHWGALSNFKLRKFDDCILWCENALKVGVSELNNSGKTFIDLEKKAKEQKKKQEDMKLQALAEKEKLDSLIVAIKERGISVAEKGLTLESVLSDYPGASGKLEMTEDVLIWPVVLIYPQYGITDFIPQFNENMCFYDYFCELFNGHPSWDIKKEYIPEKLKVYFCDKKENIVPVDPKQSLKSAMCHKRFVVTSGTLNFYVTSSEYDKIYRAQNYVAGS